jgi:hypothetical protein
MKEDNLTGVIHPASRNERPGVFLFIKIYSELLHNKQA